MKSMKVRIELTPEQKLRRQRKIEELYKNPKVQEFLIKNHLDPSILEKQSAKFVRWLDGLEGCRTCSGLPYCRQKFKGQYDRLVCADGVLDFVSQTCRFRAADEKQRIHSDHFVLSHLRKSDYEIKINNLLLTDCPDVKKPEYVSAVAEVLTSFPEKSGCLIYGHPGTGKSTLLIAAANDHARRQVRVAFIRLPQFISDLKAHLQDNEWYMKTIHTLRTVPVLFIDDLGSETITAWTRDEVLFPLLDFRMNNRLKTYFSSNLTPADLKIRYAATREPFSDKAAERLLERIHTLAKPVPLAGTSKRTLMK